MKLTVAICTWNRAALLATCLERIAACVPPRDARWEVLVVNNACTDDTDAVIEAWRHRLPLRRIGQPVPGLSNARNAAVSAAEGDYILWTDDDVRVDPDWIVAYESAIARHPGATFFGGPIRAHFDERPPAWLAQSLHHFQPAYALLDLGQEERMLGENGLPYGANWMIETAAQRDLAYDPSLGRRPDEPFLGGEESAVMLQLLARGAEGRWIPSARVAHLVSRERQQVRYLKRYYLRAGRSRAAARPLPGRQLLGHRSPWLMRQAARAWLGYVRARLLGGVGDWAPALVNAYTLLGEAATSGRRGADPEHEPAIARTIPANRIRPL